MLKMILKEKMVSQHHDEGEKKNGIIIKMKQEED